VKLLGQFPYHEPRVPHISPAFGEMWELTNAGARVPVAREKFRFEIRYLWFVVWTPLFGAQRLHRFQTCGDAGGQQRSQERGQA
jgi:hypothetical protein